MSIYFLDTEPDDAAFFGRELAGEPVHFVSRLGEVKADACVLSMFIHTPVSGAFLEKHPGIRLIATRSTGIDHIDLDACRARGVTIANVPTYGDHTVAEHTFALILTLSRRLRETIRPPGETDRVTYSDVRGFDLRDKTLGVVGAGRIGRHVIRIARAFGMRVLAFDPYLPIPADQEGGFEYAPFETLLAESHVITLHLPGRAETRHLLNADAFAHCRPGVLIVNTSRGSLIDTEALLDALDGGQVGGAGLDVLEEDSLIRQEPTRLIGAQIIDRLRNLHASEAVPDHQADRAREIEELLRNKRLLARPEVIFTPHVAFNSVEANARINARTAENIRQFLRGVPVRL